ncbi:MAG: hypothetical protein ACI9TY_000800 [Alphaproteobacteria bacterium]|jgi:hypothetical protein
MEKKGNLAESSHEEHFVEAANDAQFVQSPTADHKDALEERYQNHITVKQSVLLRSKVENSKLPVSEKEQQQAYANICKAFALDQEDLSFEEFKTYAMDVDEGQYRAKIIEGLPKEKLEQAANMNPTKTELDTIDSLALEYEHLDAQQKLFTEIGEMNQIEADLHHEEMLIEDLSPAGEFMSLQNELDDINAMETEHEQVVQETASQSVGGSMEDNIAYLFDNPEKAIRNYHEMQKADTLADITDIAHDKAGADFYQSVENTEQESSITKEGVDQLIQGKARDDSYYEILDNEKDMAGDQTLTGADNDLRRAMKVDVSRGSISSETVELQAQELSGLDDETLVRKEELEAVQAALLEERGAEIAGEMSENRADLGLDAMDMKNGDDLATAGREVEAKRAALEQEKEREEEPHMSHSL